MRDEMDARMFEFVVFFALIVIALGIGYELGTALTIERMRDYLAIRSRYSREPSESGSEHVTEGEVSA